MQLLKHVCCYSDEQIHLWILFYINGSVITCFCSCTAEHSKCRNHNAAVLYKIEYGNKKGLKKTSMYQWILPMEFISKGNLPYENQKYATFAV